MKACVIIPTKNPGALFQKVLQMALNQKTDWEYSVFVIDSGSTDGTVEYIKSVNSNKLILECIDSKEFGHGKTRNYAISKCNAEYAVLITHDALPADENWLKNLIKTIDSNERIAGVFGRHLAYEESSLFIKRDIDYVFNNINYNGTMYELSDKSRYDNDEGYRHLLHFFSDNNACVRKKVWEKFPYPDVEFAEDQIWAKKIIEVGYIKAYSHEAAVYHSHTFSVWEQFQRNYDESAALNQLFGYRFVPNFKAFIGQSIIKSKGDFKFFLSLKYKKKIDYYWLIRMPIDNFLKAFAYFLGQNQKTIPDIIKRIISRDRKLRRK